MITIKKLRRLSPGTRLRQIQRTLQILENQCGEVEKQPGLEATTRDYLLAICDLLADFPFEVQTNRLRGVLDQSPNSEGELMRSLLGLRIAILENLGFSLEDWDQEISPLDGKTRTRVFPVSLYAQELRSPFNLGSLFRSAEALGARQILISEGGVSPHHPRVNRSSLGSTELLPWKIVSQSELPDLPLVALEMGGTALENFRFPSDGILVVGNEELGVSPDLLESCSRSGGVVSIPLSGAKKSLNVGVAAAIVLQAWVSQLANKP